MQRSEAGFREHEHMADWELEVWAPTLPALFEQAARGMYALSGIVLNSFPRKVRQLKLAAVDPESLLVGFLQELLYLEETAALGFDQFDIRIRDLDLSAILTGAPILTISKEIKAVTYHNLKIDVSGRGSDRGSDRGLEVRIVFDV